MTQIIGYSALALNICSMAMKNMLYLRVGSLLANMAYVFYGILLSELPILIGSSIAIIIHAYRIFINYKNTKKHEENSICRL